ncbi:NXPE family member 3-like [Haliotis rufescens]|uniref:NXPE family member 3-like n=1 Tax=Haliotis rufescens TaxID=6454 RepID=UPI00201EAFBC|nr:NXPE family member 3-like [Haliotis rufescens]
MVVVWMKDMKNGAASAGIVKDHDNGTYTGILRTLWTGRAAMKAAVITSKERIDFTYDILRKGYQGKSINCIFRSTRAVETTNGYMDINNMKTDNLCNFTSQYHGVPFYCGKPKGEGLRCVDWTQVSCRLKKMTLSSNEQWFYESRASENLPDVINITIGHVEGDTASASRPCYLQDPRNTWRATPPVGFSYQHTWRPLSCFSNIKTTNSYHHCLANRTLRLYGDSTDGCKPQTTQFGMWGPVYENILKQEFVGINNRVVYLDFWDMTVALESTANHPSSQIVKTMLDMFFGYVCKTELN